MDKNNEIFLGRHPKRLERSLTRGGSLREAATVVISLEKVWCFGSKRSLWEVVAENNLWLTTPLRWIYGYRLWLAISVVWRIDRLFTLFTSFWFFSDHKYVFTTLGARRETGPTNISEYAGTSLESKFGLCPWLELTLLKHQVLLAEMVPTEHNLIRFLGRLVA